MSDFTYITQVTPMSQVSNYSGFIPKVKCSGNMEHYGSITKYGPRFIRCVMVQSAWVAIRTKEGKVFRDTYDRIKTRRGKSKAIVAVAWKMLEILFTLFKNKELFNAMELTKLKAKLRTYGITEK